MRLEMVPQKFPQREVTNLNMAPAVSQVLSPDTRTAVATEDLAVWTARDVVIDGLTGAFTLAAAFFAFFAYRQTKRQAVAAEKHVEMAKEELEVSKRAMTMQMRSSALSLRPQLVPKTAEINLYAIHPLGMVVFEFEPRGSLDPFEVRAGVSIGFRVPGEADWAIPPEAPGNITLEMQRHFPANESAKIRFDFEYPEQDLLARGDTWFEFRAILVFSWKDALNWTISETWEANGRVLAKKSGSAHITKEVLSDHPPE